MAFFAPHKLSKQSATIPDARSIRRQYAPHVPVSMRTSAPPNYSQDELDEIASHEADILAEDIEEIENEMPQGKLPASHTKPQPKPVNSTQGRKVQGRKHCTEVEMLLDSESDTPPKKKGEKDTQQGLGKTNNGQGLAETKNKQHESTAKPTTLHGPPKPHTRVKQEEETAFAFTTAMDNKAQNADSKSKAPETIRPRPKARTGPKIETKQDSQSPADPMAQASMNQFKLAALSLQLSSHDYLLRHQDLVFRMKVHDTDQQKLGHAGSSKANLPKVDWSLLANIEDITKKIIRTDHCQPSVEEADITLVEENSTKRRRIDEEAKPVKRARL